MAKEPKKIEPTSDETRKQIEDDILSKLPKEKVMKIPDDQIVLLPISGAFKRNMDEVLHFIMSDMDAGEIIKSFTMIRENFKGLEPEQIDIRTRCLYTMMSLNTELNYQAAEQDKWVETDQKIGDSLDKLTQMDVSEATATDYKKDRDYLKFKEWEREKNLKAKKEKALAKKKAEEEKKKKDSTEDLPQ
jgi:hypothetical protein